MERSSYIFECRRVRCSWAIAETVAGIAWQVVGPGILKLGISHGPTVPLTQVSHHVENSKPSVSIITSD